jgi:uncharacterized membrane protein YuzA (DUF378 family)
MCGNNNILTDNILTDKLLLYAAAASTFIAGVLHLALVPMFFKQMSPNAMIFFIVSGLAQLFWVIPTIKKWILPWYYIGIGGTIVLIILWIIAIPGSGYPIRETDVAIEVSQIAFIILSIIIIKKNRAEIKSSNVEM